MQGFTRFARRLVPSFLVYLVSLGGLCAAQDVDLNAPTSGQPGAGSVAALSAWLELIVPVQKRIDLNLYGFYIGRLKVPAAQLDVPIRTTKYLTITPSYLYYAIPASGLNKLTDSPGGFTRTLEEHQFRIDGTVTFFIRKLEISERNMYVRRFTPTTDINRYRNRIRIAHPLAVKGHIWKPFASYEAYYEWGGGGWNKHRVWSGVTLPLAKRVWFQPSFLWETSRGIKDINYILFGLIYRTE